MALGRENLENDLVPEASISDQAAATTFGKFTTPYGGMATLRISLPTTSTVTLYAAASGSSTLKSAGLMNSGASLTAGNAYSLDFPVTAGGTYGFQVTTAQSGDLQMCCILQLT